MTGATTAPAAHRAALRPSPQGVSSFESRLFAAESQPLAQPAADDSLRVVPRLIVMSSPVAGRGATLPKITPICGPGRTSAHPSHALRDAEPSGADLKAQALRGSAARRCPRDLFSRGRTWWPVTRSGCSVLPIGHAAWRWDPRRWPVSVAIGRIRTIPVSCRLCRGPPAFAVNPVGVLSAKIQENSISVLRLRAGEGPARVLRQ